MILKVRSQTKGNHVHTTVFVGSEDDRLACAGMLVFLRSEYQTFVNMLKEGRKGFQCEVIEEEER